MQKFLVSMLLVFSSYTAIASNIEDITPKNSCIARLGLAGLELNGIQIDRDSIGSGELLLSTPMITGGFGIVAASTDDPREAILWYVNDFENNSYIIALRNLHFKKETNVQNGQLIVRPISVETEDSFISLYRFDGSSFSLSDNKIGKIPWRKLRKTCRSIL